MVFLGKTQCTLNIGTFLLFINIQLIIQILLLHGKKMPETKKYTSVELTMKHRKSVLREI